MVFINKYTLILAWIVSPIVAIVAFVDGDTECMVSSIIIFILGTTYMLSANRAGWWPFQENNPNYVLAQEYQPNQQQPYYQQPYQQQPYQQQPYQQPYPQQPYQQQDPYGGQRYQQYRDYTDPDTLYDEEGREIRQ